MASPQLTATAVNEINHEIAELEDRLHIAKERLNKGQVSPGRKSNPEIQLHINARSPLPSAPRTINAFPPSPLRFSLTSRLIRL